MTDLELKEKIVALAKEWVKERMEVTHGEKWFTRENYEYAVEQAFFVGAVRAVNILKPEQDK